MAHKESNKVEARLIAQAQELGARTEEINAAVNIPLLRELVNRYGAMSKERTGPPVRLPTRPKPRQNKGGLPKKPTMTKGGSYKGKKHSYAAGGMVKELKI